MNENGTKRHQRNAAERKNLTLHLHVELIRRLKADAVRDGLTVSDLVESLVVGRPTRPSAPSATGLLPLHQLGRGIIIALDAIELDGDPIVATTMLREAQRAVRAALAASRDAFEAELDASAPLESDWAESR